MHVIFVLTFIYLFIYLFIILLLLFVCLFLVKNFYVFLEFNNCVCKFCKNKNKNLLKKKGIYFVLEEAKETVLNFSQGTVKIL